MNRMKSMIVAGAALLIIVLCGIIGVILLKDDEVKVTPDVQDESQDDRYVTYNGKKYEYNYDLRNILFIGVDRSEGLNVQEAGQGGQADSLILLSMDKANETTTLLEISRESMVDIKIYDADGRFLTKERAQIALQYAYGDGEKRSCQLMKETVSQLLYEIPVHSYVAMGIDGIAAVTDLMGGVRITIPKDYTHIDPAFEKGAEIVMDGKQAEKYVRYRDTSVSGSNNERMERQTQFLEALAIQLQGKDTSWYQQMFLETEEYVLTDMSIEEMERLSAYEVKEPIEVLPGEVKQGEEHDEFVVDNEKLQEMVIKVFYKLAN